MKKFFTAMAIISLIATSCKKDKTPSNEEILNNTIEQIIPKQYLDTLKKLGLNINEGTTPPNAEGIYDFKPLKLIKSNRPSDVVGMLFANAKVKLFNQSAANFGIQLLGKNFIAANDTSLVTAISGSGNNFTVYGKVKAVKPNSNNYAVFALIISGTKEGSSLKNVKHGLINIDNSMGGTGYFIEQGQGRLVYDTDYISETNPVF
jgi:hypothetical protein